MLKPARPNMHERGQDDQRLQPERGSESPTESELGVALRAVRDVARHRGRYKFELRCM